MADTFPNETKQPRIQIPQTLCGWFDDPNRFNGFVDLRPAADDKTVLKTKFHFESNVDAFDAACAAIKKVLGEVGYKEENGVFVK